MRKLTSVSVPCCLLRCDPSWWLLGFLPAPCLFLSAWYCLTSGPDLLPPTEIKSLVPELWHLGSVVLLNLDTHSWAASHNHNHKDKSGDKMFANNLVLKSRSVKRWCVGWIDGGVSLISWLPVGFTCHWYNIWSEGFSSQHFIDGQVPKDHQGLNFQLDPSTWPHYAKWLWWMCAQWSTSWPFYMWFIHAFHKCRVASDVICFASYGEHGNFFHVHPKSRMNRWTMGYLHEYIDRKAQSGGQFTRSAAAVFSLDQSQSPTFFL